VRNPWDWYVSWYAFNRRPDARNALFAVCSDGGKADFKATVTNLIQLGDDSVVSQRYRDALISVLPKTLNGNRGVGLTMDCIRGFVDNETAYYAWLFNRMIGAAEVEQVHIGKFENLQTDLIDILNKLNVQEASKIERVFARARHVNTSKHSHYSQYYDAELKELIRSKDRRIIDRFGYKFEQQQTVTDYVRLPRTYAIDGAFKKLLDKAKNFLLLNDKYDVQQLADKVRQIPSEQWTQSSREQRYMAHAQTESLLLIHDEDMRHRNPTYHDRYHSLEQELRPLMDFISSFYQDDGYVIRALFAKLLPGESIVPHIDTTFSLLHCHRLHIPIVTNSKVSFIVGGERKNMKTGEIWEINNATVHSVENHSDIARIHLIVDWVPNSTLHALERRKQSRQLQSTEIPVTTGRNEPCPCGSNRKFKHCHGAVA